MVADDQGSTGEAVSFPQQAGDKGREALIVELPHLGVRQASTRAPGGGENWGVESLSSRTGVGVGRCGLLPIQSAQEAEVRNCPWTEADMMRVVAEQRLLMQRYGETPQQPGVFWDPTTRTGEAPWRCGAFLHVLLLEGEGNSRVANLENEHERSALLGVQDDAEGAAEMQACMTRHDVLKGFGYAEYYSEQVMIRGHEVGRIGGEIHTSEVPMWIWRCIARTPQPIHPPNWPEPQSWTRYPEPSAADMKRVQDWLFQRLEQRWRRI